MDEREKCPALKIAEQCPLILLERLGWKEGKPFGD
jgi:hypothetical protein